MEILIYDVNKDLEDRDQDFGDNMVPLTIDDSQWQTDKAEEVSPLKWVSVLWTLFS